MVLGEWLLMAHDMRKVYVLMPARYHGGIVTFKGNKKGKIIRVGKIGTHPYPSIDNALFVEGLKHNLLSISQLCDSGYDVSFK